MQDQPGEAQPAEQQTQQAAPAQPAQQAQPAQPAQQTQLQFKQSKQERTQSEPAISAKDLAKMMADNERMRSRLAEFEATQSTEAKEKAQFDLNAAIDKHKAVAEAAQASADAALASARRNAVKAHYRGSLKADNYLQLVPAVEFTQDGDLTAESIELLNTFRQSHGELFNAPSNATTAMSASGANVSAQGYSEDVLDAMRINKIATPGTDRHWSKRSNVGTMADFVGFAKIGGKS